MSMTALNCNFNNNISNLNCWKCFKIFSETNAPLSLECGHIICEKCISTKNILCSLHSIKQTFEITKFPINFPLLSIIYSKKKIFERLSNRSLRAYALRQKWDANIFEKIEELLIDLAQHFHLTQLYPIDRNIDLNLIKNSFSSETLSRAIQHKLYSLLCVQLICCNGLKKAFCSLRKVIENVLTEMILTIQNNSDISSHLWSAVRARGCQFLGSVMQENVLKLILSVLSQGELIARKSLVIYIVQTLQDKYPQISKTCVGHVVQLTYRASCFNVIKRNGESSLMQLRDEFRTYENLRQEHDAQIVQIALEAGLRISPDQWSFLLYGDINHRDYMQSIVDKTSCPQLLANTASELRNILFQQLNVTNLSVNNSLSLLNKIFSHLDNFQLSVEDKDINVDLNSFARALIDLKKILEIYADFMKNRLIKLSIGKKKKTTVESRLTSNNGLNNQSFYKTKLCRNASLGKICLHGSNCIYAHGVKELCKNLHTVAKNTDIIVNKANISNCNVYNAPITCYSETHSDPALPFSINNERSSTNRGIPISKITNQLNTVQLTQAQIIQPIQLQNVSPSFDSLRTIQPIHPQSTPTVSSLTPSTGLPPATGQIVGAIDSATGNIVNLIPVQTVPQNHPSTLDQMENIPSQFVVDAIPVVPVIVPSQLDNELINEHQRQQNINQNMILVNQQNSTQQTSVVPLNNSSIIMMPSNVPPTQQIQIVSNNIINATQMFPVQITPVTQPIQPSSIINNFQPLVGSPTSTMLNQPSQNFVVLRQSFWNSPTVSYDMFERRQDNEEMVSSISNPIAIQRLDAATSFLSNGLPYTLLNNMDDPCFHNSGLEESGQLLLRRNEIINHLVDMKPNSRITDDIFDDDLENHVSFTVANSVLFEEKENSLIGGNIELPPLPIGSFNVHEKIKTSPSSLNFLTNSSGSSKIQTNIMTNYLRTASPLFSRTEGTAPATVQSGCKNVIKDVLDQPLVASTLQCQSLSPQAIVDPCYLKKQLPTVIKSLSSMMTSHPQDFVSFSLDRIVDVKERINDVEKHGANSSVVEQEQLKVELRIANQQISTLDNQTKESCLLKELKAVDEKIENLNSVT